jgi:dTDP-4-amino-4,6-dideoxygalactose transaminase
MSELHAAVALASFEDLEERIARRNALAARYREVLGAIPGVTFPLVRDADRSTYKDMAILVDEHAFGLTADDLAEALAAEGIETRRYYSPPVHRMRAYQANGAGADLPVTDAAARAALSLPLWTEMTDHHIEGVGEAVLRIRADFGEKKSHTGGQERYDGKPIRLGGNGPSVYTTNL